MKKYYLTLTTIVFCLILSGCRTSNDLSLESKKVKKKSTGIEIQKKESTNVDTDKNNQNKTISLFANIDYESNIVELIKLSESKQVYKLQMEKGTYAEKIYQIDNGYGIIVAHSKEGVNIKKFDKVSIIDFPYDISARDFVVTDSKLEVKKTICLDDYIDNQVLENLWSMVLSPDGETIAFNTSEGLFIFDVATKTCNKVFPLENSNPDCVFTDIIFADNGTLAFTGITENLRSKVIDDKSTGIGLINKEGEILFEEVISDYPVSMLTANAGYVCFLDSIDPGTGKTRGGGKVKILNSETYELKTISTDGNESALGNISFNGKYLISAMWSEEKRDYQISSYNLQNGELENRVTDKFKNMKFIEIQTQENEQAQIVYMTNDKIGAIQFDVVKH